MSRPTPSFSVIIPAYNAAATLAQTLSALAQTDPPPCEVIVVDDGSTDDSPRAARGFPVELLRLESNMGAAAAKNRGARAARGDVLVFTDSDILVPRDLVARLARDFADESLDGVVGLLSRDIPAPNWASQFKNLWMTFTYARFAGAARIGLFYTSIAAMRRATFERLGGFDENYRGASIAEDTEFGQRAWGQGANLQLDPELQVVHLKRYSIASVLREDFRRARALTLMRLRKRGQPFFTSVPVFYQLAVPVIYLTVILFALGIVTANVLWFTGALAGFVMFYLLNSSLLAFLIRERGWRFAFKAGLFLPADVLVVGLGMLQAAVDFAWGQRY